MKIPDLKLKPVSKPKPVNKPISHTASTTNTSKTKSVAVNAPLAHNYQADIEQDVAILKSKSNIGGDFQLLILNQMLKFQMDLTVRFMRGM